jgi:hypothetical protein
MASSSHLGGEDEIKDSVFTSRYGEVNRVTRVAGCTAFPGFASGRANVTPQ